jgi:hypothetical protein
MVKDRQKRMAQTLGCLVASMTACAVLLHWGQPKGDRPATPPAMELIASSVTQSWQSIRIEPARSDGRIDPKQTHFFVDREGRWSDTEAWRTQGKLKQQGVVRIAVQPSTNSNRMTAAQWDTTQRLMTVLLRTCNIPNDREHILLSDTLALPSTPRKASVSTAKAATPASAGMVRSR